jgi:hypothetical protein
MNHRLITTRGYYRIGAERRHEAVDRVTTMQFDRHGNRVWRQAGVMLLCQLVGGVVAMLADHYMHQELGAACERLGLPVPRPE